MNRNLTGLILGLAMLFVIPAHGQNDQKEATISSIRQQLSTVKTAKDSLPLYYDILDLTDRKELPGLIQEMYGVATRAGDNSARLDLCRQVTAALRDDSHFAEIEKEVRSLPSSDEQKETELFIKMKRVSYKSAHASEMERQRAITDMIRKFESKKKSDKYDRVLELFTLVEYLRNVASGDMLEEYLESLSNLVSREKFTLYAIPNIIYAEAANLYSNANEYAKSVNADRRMLEIIDGLEKKYTNAGRKYRNYDVSRFVSYRRMLRNYPALKHGEADELYGKIKKLAESNTDVRNDLETNPRTKAFYYMATGDYNSAIPYLKSCLESDNALSIRRQVLDALLIATEQTGDDKTRLYALSQYKSINEEYNRLKAAERYNELQIKYDLKSLKEENAALELKNSTDEADSARRIMTFLLVAFFILAAAMFVSLWQWGRFRRNAHKMGRIVDRLRVERNKLVEKYYDYNELDDTKAIMESDASNSYRGKKDVSSYLTECLVNDLLNISLMGGDDSLKFIQKCSVDRIMREASVKIYKQIENPSILDVEYPENDFTVITDHECLVDILAHLIESMAILGGPQNKVHIEVRHTSHAHTNFILTNKTNISSARNEAEIFRLPYVTEDSMTTDKNGLYICRMISMMLDSSFSLDKTYTDGARYIFSVPDDLTHSVHDILCRKKTADTMQ